MKPQRLGPGRTFLDSVTEQMEGYANNPITATLHQTYRYWLSALRHPEVRQFLFDAAQAEQFAPLIEFPEAWQDHVREPFPNFYMEFDQGVHLGEAWAMGENDVLRALLFARVPAAIRVYTGTNFLTRTASFETRPGLAHLVLFYHDPLTDIYTDRNFVVDVRRGHALVTRYMAEKNYEWRFATTTEKIAERFARDAVSGAALNVLERQVREGTMSRGDMEMLKTEIMIPTDAHDRSTGLEVIPDDSQTSFIAGDFPNNRHVGWWERQATAATSFLQWCLAYMMAKSIVVEIRDVSRQQKRWLQRHDKPLPKPWHVIMVDPSYVRTIEDNPNPGYHHSYRYDVMGHLRVGRHRIGRKLEDGSYEYKQTLEWVPSHQRGLANEIYIPATRAVQKGRKIPSEIRTGKVSDV